ncbi:MAG: family 4 glycosyl hydrolase [Candidatus Hodarchaeales archaeon]|jgi:alpha-galactosidase
MPDEPKIVIIGAGSASFGLENLGGIFQHDDLDNSTLALVDINEENLKLVTTLATRMKREWKSNITIKSTINRKEELSDADFVVLSVALDREETWKKDHELGKKYGIWHYAENGGPGSFGHTARGLAFIMPILYDIHDLAPDSWLINFTNPVPRIQYAANHAKVQCISYCHQIWHGYAILGRILAADLGITENLDWTSKWTEESFQISSLFSANAISEYNITAAGINHFTWMTDVQRRDTGEDMYPLIRKEITKLPNIFEPLTQDVFRAFGLLPVPGDCHLAEYLPYTSTKENWMHYNIQLYDFDYGKKSRKKMWNLIQDMANGKQPLDLLLQNPSEHGEHIIAGIFFNKNAYEPALNITNNGTISNLPDDAIVEVPVTLNKKGTLNTHMGKLPAGIAALCQREISIAKLITQASIEGDREKALTAFALMVEDLSLVETILDDYLESHKKYLPQFFH